MANGFEFEMDARQWVFGIGFSASRYAFGAHLLCFNIWWHRNWMEEDTVLYGVGVSKGGKRVDPREFYDTKEKP